MAHNPYPKGLLHLVKTGADNIDWRILLVSSDNTNATAYVYGSTHEFVDNGASNSTNPLYCQTTATDYARQTCAVTVQLDTGNTRLELIFPDTTFCDPNLGNGVNEIMTAAIVYDHIGADDTANPLIAYYELGNKPSSGQPYVLDFDPNEGNLRIPYTIA
jgi:hypothetical protein